APTTHHQSGAADGSDASSGAGGSAGKSGDVPCDGSVPGSAKRKGPPPNHGKMGGSGVHGGSAHDNAINDYIENLPPEAENVRKGQAQVDVNGDKVGNNMPDVQYDLDGKHHNVEFNTRDSRGHGDVIRANDPNSEVTEYPVKE
ncbi:MAG TPA: hypothetical protein VN541_09210, partial [Tepidisphaeraceae bacterium]|nr:hypothetical protein [Tepidisphaeraceae bacterium]